MIEFHNNEKYVWECPLQADDQQLITENIVKSN